MAKDVVEAEAVEVQRVAKPGRPPKQRRMVSLPMEDTRDSPEDLTDQVAEAKDVGGVVAWRKGPSLVILYDPRGKPVLIQASPHNFQQLLADGWTVSCPHCGGQHENWDDPNACPALPKLRYAICEVCGKRVYDDRDLGQVAAVPANDDPQRIQVAALIPSDPDERVLAKLREHYRAFHPSHARSLTLLGAKR